MINQLIYAILLSLVYRFCTLLWLVLDYPLPRLVQAGFVFMLPDVTYIFYVQVYVGEWLRHYTPIKERTASSNTDKLGQLAVSNASKRRLAGSGL